jgi:hypothetical protein
VITEAEIGIVEDDEVPVCRANGSTAVDVIFAARRRLRWVGTIQTKELLDPPDASIAVALVARVLRPDRVGV